MPITFVAATEATSATATVTINVPSGVQDGDTLILVCTQSDGEDGSWNALSGWTEEVVDAVAGGSAPSSPECSVFSRIASSEPSNYAPSVDNTGGVGTVAKMLAFRGGDVSTIMDQTPTTATGSGNATPDPPSITTVTDGAFVVAVGFMDAQKTLTSVPTNYTDPGGLAEISSAGGGNGCTLGVAYREIVSSGAEDPGVFTFNSADEWGAISVAIRPIVGPTITSVDTDDDIDDEQDPVLVAGSAFGASDTGSADVEIGDNSVYATANKISQTRNSWSATSISIIADMGAQSPGTKWVFVTDSAGAKNDPGFPIAMHRAQAFGMAASANIAASGENTTAQLTAPSGKTTGDMDGGRIQDDENPSDAVDVTEDDYREDEWCIEAVTAAEDGAQYEFRVLYGGNVPDTISVTPKCTISSAVSKVVKNPTVIYEAQKVVLSTEIIFVAKNPTVEYEAQKAVLSTEINFVVNNPTLEYEAQKVVLSQRPADRNFITNNPIVEYEAQKTLLSLEINFVANNPIVEYEAQETLLQIVLLVQNFIAKNPTVTYEALKTLLSTEINFVVNNPTLEYEAQEVVLTQRPADTNLTANNPTVEYEAQRALLSLEINFVTNKPTVEYEAQRVVLSTELNLVANNPVVEYEAQKVRLVLAGATQTFVANNPTVEYEAQEVLLTLIGPTQTFAANNPTVVYEAQKALLSLEINFTANNPTVEYEAQRVVLTQRPASQTFAVNNPTVEYEAQGILLSTEINLTANNPTVIYEAQEILLTLVGGVQFFTVNNPIVVYEAQKLVLTGVGVPAAPREDYHLMPPRREELDPIGPIDIMRPEPVIETKHYELDGTRSNAR